jgi:hypothetical protein
VLPRGWQLHNDLAAERDDTQAPPPPVRRARASIARARRRRSASTAVALPGLSAVTDAEPAEAGRVEPVTAPHVPDATPEATIELAETLDAQTPLLRRAFSNVVPPENENES